MTEKEQKHYHYLLKKSESRLKRGLSPHTKSMKEKIDAYEALIELGL